MEPRDFVARLHWPEIKQLAATDMPPPVTDMPPRISVVMPSYNQARFIERSILSVLNQNYPNLDFIIIDGGSSDGTVDIIRKYEKYLSYWISEPDAGQSDALNKGYGLASGEIFGWMNSDDVYLPGAFAYAVAALEDNPNKKIVFGDWLLINVDDDVQDVVHAFDFSLSHLKYEGFHTHPQSMFWRREVHERFEGFDVTLHNTMDYQMFLAIGSNEGDAAFLRIPRPLGAFRCHEEQKTGNFPERVAKEHIQIATRFECLDKFTLAGAVKRFAYRLRRAYWYQRRGGITLLAKRLRESYVAS
jgi:glycosyltransferase involved in cell wall biosynthesis